MPHMVEIDWERDAQLLQGWGAGDKSAGKELYDRHAPAVLRFYQNKLPDDAEELTQQTFLALVESHGRIREGVRVRAFILGIARHKLLNHFRKLSRSPFVEHQELPAIADMTPGASSVLAHKREQRLLLEGLRRIPIEHQTALELFYWEGLKAGELADVFGISASAMRSRLAKARALLEQTIHELAESPALSKSTITDLDDWAASIRARI